MWAVQPEIGVGYYDFDKDIYYYSLGIRYERSVESLNYRLHNWPGIINGWSVGISAKMKYAHFFGCHRIRPICIPPELLSIPLTTSCKNCVFHITITTRKQRPNFFLQAIIYNISILGLGVWG